jgi:hypothetical protein
MSRINLYIILGFIFGTSTLILGIFPEIKGVTLIPIFILLILFVVHKSIKTPVTLLIFLILIVLFTLINYFSFTKTEYSNYKVIMILVKLIPMILIPMLLKEKIIEFISGYAIAGTLTILYIVIIFLSNHDLIGSNSRIYIGNLNPIWISRIIFELIILVGIYFNKKTYAFVLLLCSLPVVYYSGSKGPLFSFFIILFIHQINKIQNLPFQRKIFYHSIIIILILVSVFLISYLLKELDQNSYLVQRFFRAVPDYAIGENYETSRVVVWPRTLILIKQNFFKIIFTGYGIGNYSYLYYGNIINDRIYPHNIILEFIVEYGLIFTTILVTLLILLLKTFSANNFKYLLFYCILNSMVSGDIILNEYIFFYLSSMVIFTLYKKNNSFFLTNN